MGNQQRAECNHTSRTTCPHFSCSPSFWFYQLPPPVGASTLTSINPRSNALARPLSGRRCNWTCVADTVPARTLLRAWRTLSSVQPCLVNLSTHGSTAKTPAAPAAFPWQPQDLMASASSEVTIYTSRCLGPPQMLSSAWFVTTQAALTR